MLLPNLYWPIICILCMITFPLAARGGQAQLWGLQPHAAAVVVAAAAALPRQLVNKDGGRVLSRDLVLTLTSGGVSARCSSCAERTLIDL